MRKGDFLGDDGALCLDLGHRSALIWRKFNKLRTQDVWTRKLSLPAEMFTGTEAVGSEGCRAS